MHFKATWPAFPADRFGGAIGSNLNGSEVGIADFPAEETLTTVGTPHGAEVCITIR